ncbi:MAG TPA: ABC transporter permease, partial [Planctomycetota bacterium]|nr:ABC transporter permease [Planctomycetota bacterium]
SGLALGIGIARAFLLGGYTTLGRTGRVDVLDVRWGPCAAIATVGLGVALLGSVFPLLKARGISPARALASRDLGRETDLFRGLNLFSFAVLAGVVPALYFFVVPVIGETSRELARILVLGGAIFLLFLGFLLLAPRLLGAVCSAIARPLTRWRPLEGFLASRSMQEGLARVAISAAVLALVASALLTLKAITASLRSEVASWGDAIERKVFVSSQPPLPRARAEALRSIAGVTGIETLGTWVDSPFMLRAIRVADVGPYGPFRDPEIARRFEETESVILSTALARSLKKDVGAQIAVAVASGPPRRLRVIAIDDAVGYFPSQRELGVVSETWMRRWFCRGSDEVSQMALRLGPGIDPNGTAASAKERLADLPPVHVRTGRSVRDYEVEDIDRDFRLFDLILGLVGLLAGVGVLNALLLAAIERRKEIGVLKALGMTSGQLAGTVALEASAIGAVGGLCGIGLGLAFGTVAVDALARLAALPLPTIFEPTWMVAAFAGSIALALVASAIPIQRANQFRAAEAVRYE